LRWFRQLSGVEQFGWSLKGISYIDDSIGTAVGDQGVILKTTNGGSKWSMQASGTLNSLNTVRFTDSMIGTAIGDGGIVLHTTDGGITWTTRATAVTDWLTGLTFMSKDTGLMVGSHGTILKTVDGGVTWKSQTTGSRTAYYSVSFGDALTGVAVGYRGSTFRTRDGGSTWDPTMNRTPEHLHGVCYADRNIAVAVGEGGAILRSTDGGVSWIDQSIPYALTAKFTFSAVAFGSPSTGVIVGRLDTSVSPLSVIKRSAIFRTTDGGKQWVRAAVTTSSELFAVSFGDESTVTAVGDGGLILHSTDKGATWRDRSTSLTVKRLNGIAAASRDTITAVGDAGTIIRTTDGGASWVVQSSWVQDNLYAVWLVDADVGLAVGEKGLMLRTTNGGYTWQRQISPTSNGLRAMWFTGRNRGVVVGEYGTILVTGLADVVSDVGGFTGEGTGARFGLAQNYPNPFNAATVISYQLAANSTVAIKVYDVLGRLVATLVNEYRRQGIHAVQWNVVGLPSGVYFYQLQADGLFETRKMVLTK
jgi:photosystem II stability/assembly factor-like uncharacterized protein